MGDINFKWRWPFQMPTRRHDSIQEWLDSGVEDEKEARNRKLPWKGSGEYLKMQAHKEAVDQKARMAEFEAAQQGARQSFAKHGKPFAMSRYKDTSMFPAKSLPVSDPGRLQAAPVGYDKEEWWRQSPYVSPRQPGYSIFSMKPYSW